MNTSANDLVNKKKKIKSLLSNKDLSCLVLLFEPNLVPRSFPVNEKYIWSSLDFTLRETLFAEKFD